MMDREYDVIAEIFARAGFPFEEDRITLFGVRSLPEVKENNKFDDFKAHIFKASPKLLDWLKGDSWDAPDMQAWLEEKTSKYVVYHRGTTDPGTVWGDPKVREKYGIKSADWMLPGCYVNMYRHGNHRGYPALVQSGCKVQATSGRYSADITEGYFGLNWHRAAELQIVGTVGLYSAGCQVHQDPNEFEVSMKLCAFQEAFTYALFEQLPDVREFDFMYSQPVQFA